MDGACLTSREELESPTGKGPVRSCIVTPHNGSSPHALLYDVTHDNESMLDKRSAEDTLSTGALVAFSNCAIGSVKGFDDLYPKLLNLVQERRQYEVTDLGDKSGIARVKRVVNALHTEMVQENYVEGHVHQENDVSSLMRTSSSMLIATFLLVYRSTSCQSNYTEGIPACRSYRLQQRLEGQRPQYALSLFCTFAARADNLLLVEPIKLSRTKAKFLLGASIEISSYDVPKEDPLLRGLPSRLVEFPEVVVPQTLDHEGPHSEIIVPDNFPPGSIMIFETHTVSHDASLDAYCSSGAQEVFQDLDLIDLNAVLHCADGEERDASDGEFGVYDVPGLGKLVYCGLQGWMHPLKHIMRHNDLGHPLCAHLREGTWSFDYIHQRLYK